VPGSGQGGRASIQLVVSPASAPRWVEVRSIMASERRGQVDLEQVRERAIRPEEVEPVVSARRGSTASRFTGPASVAADAGLQADAHGECAARVPSHGRESIRASLLAHAPQAALARRSRRPARGHGRAAGASARAAGASPRTSRRLRPGRRQQRYQAERQVARHLDQPRGNERRRSPKIAKPRLVPERDATVTELGGPRRSGA